MQNFTIYYAPYIQAAILIVSFVAAIVILVAGRLLMRRRNYRKQSRIVAHARHRHVEDIGTVSAPRAPRFSIRSLSGEERERLTERWRAIEGRFAEDPRGAIEEADDLVNRGLVARGYPMHDFEQNSAGLLVDHREVVENYRVAHTLGKKAARGSASTEGMRCAMQSYRALMESICESREFADDTWSEATSTLRVSRR
jgi:hypothetical protein